MSNSAYNDTNKIAILDAGAQYTKVIDRKVRELEVCTEILSLETPVSKFKDSSFKGIIISGGPGSVFDELSPQADPELFDCGIPILGICYGLQLMASNFGGTVKKSESREDGQYAIDIDTTSPLFKGLSSKETVLLTHADYVEKVDGNFAVIGKSKESIAAISWTAKKLFGVQFHPEVDLTINGIQIFKNFLFDICQLSPSYKIPNRMENCLNFIRDQVRDRKVLMLMSGGVDSAVCCALLHKALGQDKVVAVHIDNGFMRKNESATVMEALEKIGIKVRLINAQLRFGAGTTTHQVRLDGDQIRNIPIGPLNLVTLNPEEKRKIIGDIFIQVVKELWQESLQDDMMLGQGTLRPDLIESASSIVSSKADAIKTHHNDTELVRQLRDQGRVIEPLTDFHKDEVRQIGRELNLPDSIVNRQPFPGPGLAVRVICAQEPYCERDFTETSSIIKIISSYNSMSQKPHSLLNRIKSSTSESEQETLSAITVRHTIASYLLPIQTVGVQGDCRTYSYPCVLSTEDEPDWKALYFLAKLIPRVCHNINRVVYVFGDLIQHSIYDVTITYLREPILACLREADYRANQVLRDSGECGKISQMPVVLIPIHFDRDPSLVIPVPSVLRSVVLRPFITNDFMTGLPAIPGVNISEQTVNKIVSAVSQVPGISRVLYDLTSKPPGTTEWE